MGFKNLIPVLDATIPRLAKFYTVDSWRADPDSNKSKGFFQWSCLAFWEYQRAGWKHSELCQDYVIAMAWWMIHTHRTLNRKRNTGYAYEGIIPAYQVAKKRKDAAAMQDLAYSVDRGLYGLTSWQVSGPLQSKNAFLSKNPTTDKLAIGGVMNHKEEAPLRIDVTQHQMHAVTLALRYVYRK
jgi:UDP-N-acetylmuramoyl-tripeptide--D-alanyl-D-alanine ligase